MQLRIYTKYKFVIKLCWMVAFAEIKISQTYWRKMYVLFFTLLHILCYVYLTVGKFQMDVKQLSFLTSFSDQISALFLTIGCICMTISSGFFFPTNLLTILQNVQDFDNNSFENSNNSKRNLKHLCSLIAIFLSVMINLFVESYTWIRVSGVENYHYYFGRNLQILLERINISLLYVLARELWMRFSISGVMLEELYSILLDLKTTDAPRVLNLEAKLLERTKKISALHNGLCDTSDLLSKLYGFHLLFDILYSIAFSILYSALMINFTLYEVEEAVSIYGADVRIVSCLWLIEFSVSICYMIRCSVGIIFFN